MPTAYGPAAGSAKSTTSRRNASGIWVEDARRRRRCPARRPRRPVIEVAQRGQRLVDDVVARAAGEGRHEGDAAGVVLVRGS